MEEEDNQNNWKRSQATNWLSFLSPLRFFRLFWLNFCGWAVKPGYSAGLSATATQPLKFVVHFTWQIIEIGALYLPNFRYGTNICSCVWSFNSLTKHCRNWGPQNPLIGNFFVVQKSPSTYSESFLEIFLLIWQIIKIGALYLPNFWYGTNMCSCLWSFNNLTKHCRNWGPQNPLIGDVFAVQKKLIDLFWVSRISKNWSRKPVDSIWNRSENDLSIFLDIFCLHFCARNQLWIERTFSLNVLIDFRVSNKVWTG